MKKNLYKDLIHGFEALAPSRTMAWMLIRNKCHEENIEVPTMDKVVMISEPNAEVSDTRDDEESGEAG